MNPSPRQFSAENLEVLFQALRRQGYSVLGPTVRDQVVVYDEVTSTQDLPRGWTEDQEKGIYRLKRRADQAFFGFNLGPHSWKQFLFSAREKLWSARRRDGQMEITETSEPPRRIAFFGARACELAAISIQDKIFMQGPVADRTYSARRDGVLVIAVECTQSAPTCFCVSMKTGPQVESHFDLALTEVLDQDCHYFLARAGTAAGEALLDEIAAEPATEPQVERARRVVEQAGAMQTRQIDNKGITELLYNNLNHARWDEVAQRCLSCANCTLVCPTCFCSNVEDVSDVTGDHTERWRRWDSCFTLDHSYVHGGSVRASVKSRYRQWLTHKLGSWWDQFGSSGCVGCGRCVTWCPVGIDLTEEAAALRRPQGQGEGT